MRAQHVPSTVRRALGLSLTKRIDKLREDDCGNSFSLAEQQGCAMPRGRRHYWPTARMAENHRYDRVQRLGTFLSVGILELGLKNLITRIELNQKSLGEMPHGC